MSNEVNNTELAKEKVPSRDDIRAAIFSSDSKKPQVFSLTFFGQKLELRQPSVDNIIKLSDESSNTTNNVVDILIEYAFIPGTTEKVFEKTDADAIKSLPFNKDFSAVIAGFKELTDINLEEEAKN